MAAENMRVRLEAPKATVEALQAILAGMEGFEIQPPADERPPDLLVLELGPSVDGQFERIQGLLADNAVGDIFLTAARLDPELLRRAMRAGVKEFFPQPIPQDEVRQALEHLRSRRLSALVAAPRRPGLVLNVVGSKGGVGTTTVAVNLAVSLAQRKGRPSVALVDMNVLFGEIPAFLDINPSYHWGEIARNIERMDETFLASILSRHASGIHVLTSPHYLDGRERVTPDTARRLLDLMRQMYAFIVIDAGQALDDTALTILEMSDRLVLVAILSLPCLSNTARLLKSIGSLGYPMDKVRVVANRCLKRPDIPLKDAETGIGERFFWDLPNDYRATMTAINAGKPLLQVAPKAAISLRLRALADALAPEEAAPPAGRRGLFRRH